MNDEEAKQIIDDCGEYIGETVAGYLCLDGRFSK